MSQKKGKRSGRHQRKPKKQPSRKRQKKRFFGWKPILALLVVIAVALGGFFVWPYLTPAPEVVRPENLDAIDPAVAELIGQLLPTVEAQPRAAEAHGDLGLAYEANRLWVEAQACFENAIRLAPGEMSWRLHLAIVMQKNGAYSEALDLLQVLAQEYDDVPAIQHRLGDALMETGDLASAEIAFRRLIELAPQSPQGYTGLGEVMLYQQKVPQAVQLLEQAVSLQSDFPTAHYVLGKAYRRLGRHTEATRELTRGVASTKTYYPGPLNNKVLGYAVLLETRMQIARWALNAGNTQQAVQLLEEAFRYHSSNVHLLNNLAIAYLRAKRPEDAERLLFRAKELDPKRAVTYLNYVALFLRTQRLDQALTHADAAIARAPEEDKAHLARAQVLSRMRRFEEALTSAREARRLDARKPQNHFIPGDLCLELGRYEEARNYYRDALAQNADLPQGWIGLARSSWELGRRDEARAALNEARRRAPNHPLVAQLTHQFQAGQ